MDLQAIAELQRYARYSIRKTAEITSLRVQNIEIIAKPAEKMFDLIFTIVDQPPVEDLGIELPIEAVSNLTDRKGQPGNGPHVSYDKGYTSGDMAGLAFGM